MRIYLIVVERLDSELVWLRVRDRGVRGVVTFVRDLIARRQKNACDFTSALTFYPSEYALDGGFGQQRSGAKTLPWQSRPFGQRVGT